MANLVWKQWGAQRDNWEMTLNITTIKPVCTSCLVLWGEFLPFIVTSGSIKYVLASKTDVVGSVSQLVSIDIQVLNMWCQDRLYLQKQNLCNLSNRLLNLFTSAPSSRWDNWATVQYWPTSTVLFRMLFRAALENNSTNLREGTYLREQAFFFFFVRQRWWCACTAM